MAYSKQTWTNDVSKVNADRMNHIELGIEAISNDVTSLNNKVNPSGTATTTAEIESGQINDVIGFKSLKLKGQTSQGENPSPDNPQEVNNVSGDNVIQISNKNVLPNPIKSQTLNGVTVTRNSDGTLLINGTATANTYFDFSTDFDTTKYAGYKFYGFPNPNPFRIRISNSDRVSIQDIDTNGTAITDNGTGKYISIRIASGSNVNNRLLSPMLIAPTTTDTTYIEHQGNNFEINLGKNLLNNTKSTTTLNGLTFTINKDKSVSIKGTATAQTDFYLVGASSTYDNIGLNAGTYNLSGCINGSSSTYMLIATRKNSSGNTSVYPVSTSSNGIAMEVENDYTFRIFIRVMNGTAMNTTIYPQLEKGSTATSYAPYFPPIELCKISTYEDYIYKKDGKWYKYKIIQKTIFDGTEEWRKSGNTSVDRFWLKLYNGNVPSFHNMFSNKFNYQYNVSSLNVAWIDVYEAEERLFVNYTAYGTTTLEQFQEWLATAKPIFYYPLAKPIEEEITYTPLIIQLDELYNSGLYDVTNISQDNSSEAFILDFEACKNNINGIVKYIRR